MYKWETRDQDIAMARRFLQEHFMDEAEEFRAGLEQVSVADDSDIRIERAGWVIALEDIFQAHYGEHQGEQVTRQVLTALIAHGQPIH